MKLANVYAKLERSRPKTLSVKLPMPSARVAHESHGSATRCVVNLRHGSVRTMTHVASLAGYARNSPPRLRHAQALPMDRASRPNAREKGVRPHVFVEQ